MLCNTWTRDAAPATSWARLTEDCFVWFDQDVPAQSYQLTFGEFITFEPTTLAGLVGGWILNDTNSLYIKNGSLMFGPGLLTKVIGKPTSISLTITNGELVYTP